MRRGQVQAAEFTRYGKNGKLVVINASYNPILDAKGKVTKVVKFATDVTERVHDLTWAKAGTNIRRWPSYPVPSPSICLIRIARVG